MSSSFCDMVGLAKAYWPHFDISPPSSTTRYLLQRLFVAKESISTV